MTDNPTDMTYRDYRDKVELAAEVALDSLEQYPEDYDTADDAVRDAIQGDRLFTNYGFMLMTVLLSDQSPEAPDYCARWQAFVDLSSDPTWSDCVSAMARVCYYSDVSDSLNRLQTEQEES